MVITNQSSNSPLNFVKEFGVKIQKQITFEIHEFKNEAHSRNVQVNSLSFR